ncbi:hypothetical protein [Marinifilum flexuosum]|uniref:hypothetical protein n=1 Tax=Marinifilum flexuosum TaxID=1117708 RepID=UPI0024932478|nr:hypothetical protein [Marinifilum flexuosum]
MEHKLIELHVAQLEKAWKKVKTCSFHDKRLQEHVALLDRLFNGIKEKVNNGIDLSKIEVYKRFIDFTFINIEFIDSSTLNLIPYEIIRCLESVLKEWLPDFEKYIIVTALRQNVYSYSISLASSLEAVYKAIEEEFKIVFPCRLIQLNIPKFLSRDYLANVVLYHEIGHFIDNQYKISKTIVKGILATKKYDKYKDYLPAIEYIGKLSDSEVEQMMLNHTMEYFADIFASQYIGDSSGNFLNYIAKDAPYSFTHPATKMRFQIVCDFMEKKENSIISALQTASTSISKNDLQLRNSTLSPDDFLNLIPVEVNSDSELHSLFVLGWEIWFNKIKEIHDVNQIAIPLENNKLYLIINSLIEKSIGNYIVKENWTYATKKS